MTVKQFLEQIWKSFTKSFVLVVNGVSYETTVFDLSLYLDYREFLVLKVDYVSVSNNKLYIYCC